ncbi:N-acetylmuramoyl-L-alanine amidase [Arcanobacterium wilhelmae]|uniref:N-acetylmuramoyl-L-alanine amidase n=1 Tax=Arcanobacterium wilhelmae TaxID=1803177 RepID=UPI0024158A49|nr:N-acetylmuramoyl-L-alanine amidase [Arcanobacterium wilhelmae]WFN91038.1 N-acetylmuramoyl-L-alanine amidase [Arcanobacterium wilhelmae]
MIKAHTLIPVLSLGLAPLAIPVSPLAIPQPDAYVFDLLDVPALEAPESAAPTTAPAGYDVVVDAASSRVAPVALGGTNDYTVITQPLDTQHFNVAAATWTGADPQLVEMRTRTNGTWSPWYSLDIERDEGRQGEAPGTEPMMAAGADGVQVRAKFIQTPKDFQVALLTGAGTHGTEREARTDVAEQLPPAGTDKQAAIGETTTFENALFREAPTSITNAAFSRDFAMAPAPVTNIPAPTVVSRAQWGAPAKAEWRPESATLKAAVIHHTAGNNTYTSAQSPSIVKAIWNYHANMRQWGDIGYNFLIDKYGTVFEGREGSLNSPAGKMSIGAHAAPANSGSVGISVMGNYSQIQPPQAAIDQIVNMIAWQFGRAGIDPNGTWSTMTKFAKTPLTKPVILGHKDVSYTDCPALIENYLPTIRANVAKAIADASADQTTSPTPISQNQDYSEQKTANYSWNRTDIGWGWASTQYTAVFAAGDLDGNGYNDMMLTDRNGFLWFYPMNSRTRFMQRLQVGWGWRNMSTVFGGSDFDGDGNVDILGIEKVTGNLILYPGRGDGHFLAKKTIGVGWGDVSNISVTGNGFDGKPMIMGTSAGYLRAWRTDGRGNLTTRTTFGPGWNTTVLTAITGDITGDGIPDMWAVRNNGDLYLYAPKDGRAQTFNYSKIGYGWKGIRYFLTQSGDPREVRAIFPDGILRKYTLRSLRMK